MIADRIALVGFMGSGKSTIGPRLASRFGLAFVDLDRALVERAGEGVDAVFARAGEAGFRRLESEVLEDHLWGPPVVVSTGGGVVERENNRELLRSRCTVVWLDARFETIRRRLAASEEPRPLLHSLGWDGTRRLHRRRRTLYAACADFRFDTDREVPARLVRRIESALRRPEAVSG